MSWWRRTPDGDVTTTVASSTNEDLLRHVTAALSELLDDGTNGLPERVGVLIPPGSTDVIVARFVEDLLTLRRTAALVPKSIARLQLDGDGLRAAIEGRVTQHGIGVELQSSCSVSISEASGYVVARLVLPGPPILGQRADRHELDLPQE